jgi:hypothetical protein
MLRIHFTGTGRRLLLAALIAAATGVHAQPSPRPPAAGDRWAASVHFENDLFADTDSQYTNGIKLTVVSPDLTSAFDDRDELNPTVQRAMNWLLPLVPFIEEGNAARTLAFSVGQNMYTPDDILSRDLVVEDRPYAGWLYLATTFQTRTHRRQDTFDVQLGIVGPYSFAEQTQDLVHRLRKINRPQGWNHQIRTEPGLVLAYERALRSPLLLGSERRLGADLVGRFGGAVGNVAIYASAGGQARVGWNLPPDFGYSVIRPGGVTQVNSLPDGSETGSAEAQRRGWLRRKGLSVYLFAGTTGRAVARDLFLDGNTFRDSHHVDHRALVLDVMGGVTLGYRGLKLSLARVWRSREFKGQSRAQRFGSITLGYSF